MELKVKKEELLKGTGRAQAISEKRSSMQILSNLLVNASEAGLEVVATDLEISFRGFYPAQISRSGHICLPARTFHNIIRELPSEEIFIQEQDNHRVLIVGGRTKYHLAGLPPEEFPALPSHDDVDTVEVPVDEFKEMLDKTIYSMAAEEGRYNLAGVYLEKIENERKLRMVSTDGHRLSVIDRPLERLANLDLAKGAIIPRKGVLEMRRLLDEADKARLGIKGTAAVLKVGEADLIMRLLDTRYPDYRQVIPSEEEAVTFTIKRPELLEAVRRMVIMVTDKYRGIKLSLSPEGLEISHQNPELGEAKETMEAQFEGEPFEIGFNAGYLVDALKAMRSEEITFSLIDPSRPSKITGPADEEFLAVIMPMQI